MNKRNLPMVLSVFIALALSSSLAVASELDGQIEAASRNSYTFKTLLKDDNIEVRSKEGAVTLTGVVGDENHKSLAQNTVESLPGVESVDNQIQVTPQAPPKDSDAWLSFKVKSALLFRRNVSALATKVFAKDGVITLEGEAANGAQKELTGQYVQDVEGVKSVKNNITVVERPEKPIETMKEKIDDASITAQVKMTLLFNRSTSALKTKVETRSGIVSLTGKAKNTAEKDLVTKLVSEINGVENVVNNMDIENS